MNSKSANPKIGIWVYFFWPFLFVAICWGIHFYDVQPKLGVQPRKLEGLIGIITHPFFHGDFNHLANNSIPFLLLGSCMFFFYKDLSYKVFFWMYLGTGIWLWSFGREANHIGASGVIYSMYAFITVSGILRKNKNLLAISFLTILIYGSMTMGVLPLDPKVSWEGHLSGFILGIILAVYFRKEGPQEIIHPINPDDSFNEFRYGPDYWKTPDQIAQEMPLEQDNTDKQAYTITYSIVPKKQPEKKN